MQADSADVESSHEYRLIVRIRGVHPAPFIPGAQKCPRQPIGLITRHTVYTCSRYIPCPSWTASRDTSSSPNRKPPPRTPPRTGIPVRAGSSVKQENDFGERTGFYVPSFPVRPCELPAETERSFFEMLCSQSDRHGHKRVVPWRNRPYSAYIRCPAIPGHNPCEPYPWRIPLPFLLFRPNPRPHISKILHNTCRSFSVHRVPESYPLRNCKSAVLLCCSAQDNVSHHIECRVESLRFVVPDISHLKAIFKHCCHIEQTAVDRVKTGRLVMDINVAVLACLQLIAIHKNLRYSSLFSSLKNQASLCRHKRTVRVGVALIADIADGLALCIHIIHHMYKVYLVVPIITVALLPPRDSLPPAPLPRYCAYPEWAVLSSRVSPPSPSHTYR